MYVGNKYRYTNTIVSLLNYKIFYFILDIWKIFLMPNVEKQFKELVKIKFKELEIKIIITKCDKEYSQMFLNYLSTLSR